MGLKKNNPGCTCCEGPCVSFDDVFSRADSTNIGSDWDEVAGDWSIVSGTLRVSSANALALITQTGTRDEMQIQASCILPANGDQLTIYVDYQDASNHHRVEFTRGTPGTVKLFKRTAGVDEELNSVSATFGRDSLGNAIQFSLQVCLVNGRLTTEWVNGGFQPEGPFFGARAFSDTTAFGVSRYGVGTGTMSGTMRIDAVHAGDITAEGECEICGGCGPCDHTHSGQYQLDLSTSGTYILNRDFSGLGNECRYEVSPGYRIGFFDGAIGLDWHGQTFDGPHIVIAPVGSLTAGWLKPVTETFCDLVDFELGTTDRFGGNTSTETLTVNAL